MRYPAALFKSTVLLLFTLSLTASTCFGQNEKAEAPGSQAKRGGIVTRIYRQQCFPAEVSAITGGTRDPGAFLSELTIKSYSPKVIKAVRLGWYLYDEKIYHKLWDAGCGDEPIKEKPILSGQTPLIELGRMSQNQSFNVGTVPRLILWPADVTLFVTTPFVMMSDISSLSTDGTLKGMKEVYGMFVAVREVHYEDGTRWVAEGELPYMKPTK